MKVLVANRGEIAARICRTLRAYGIRSVAVRAPEDEQALHVTRADEVVELDTSNGYLNGEALVLAAQRVGATHVHPGYGFLSQSPAFVLLCERAGLAFIGPSADAMRALGDKRAARILAQKLGIPVVAGADVVASVQDVDALATRLGYPLLLKAAASGGGRGMRAIFAKEEVQNAFASAAREAQRSSNDARILCERLLRPVRHIEVQVAGDGSDARALGLRECSLQRRYQKVIEEAPAASVPSSIKDALIDASERLARAAGYKGLLTVEFLFTPEGAYYFLEVNPRLQVEHPVTEMTLQLDLVALQLELSGGAKISELALGSAQNHAIEVRVLAEDPARGFMPQTGVIALCEWPSGPFIRVDAGVMQGSHVTAHFDSLLGKIVAWGSTREVARRRLVVALEETLILGVQHNVALLRRLLSSEQFVAGETYTHELDASPFMPAKPDQKVAALIKALDWKRQMPRDAERGRRTGPWHGHNGHEVGR